MFLHHKRNKVDSWLERARHLERSLRASTLPNHLSSSSIPAGFFSTEAVNAILSKLVRSVTLIGLLPNRAEGRPDPDSMILGSQESILHRNRPCLDCLSCLTESPHAILEPLTSSSQQPPSTGSPGLSSKYPSVSHTGYMNLVSCHLYIGPCPLSGNHG